MSLPKFNLFFEAPTDMGGGAKELTVNDMIDELGKDDAPTDDDEEDILDEPDEKKSKKEVKEEEEEELEIDEEEEPDEEKLDSDNQDVPRRQEILKAFPELFKKFPGIESAIYREKKYAEYFPSLDDAKQASEKVESFNAISGELMSGNLGGVLNALKGENKKGYDKVVDGYLDTLKGVDETAYYHVISNTVKGTIAAMIREGKSTENEQLQAAAVILNQFIFGTTNYTPPARFSKEDNAADEQINSERQEILTERLDGAIEDVTSRTSKIISSTIAAHIDPKGSMTDYVKRVAMKDAIADVDKLIKNDTRFKASLDKLWEKAANNKFSAESKQAITTAYLNRAKVLLPAIIKTHRNAALKGLGKRVQDDEEVKPRKESVSVGRSASADNRGKDNTGKIPKGMKTLDFLNSD